MLKCNKKFIDHLVNLQLYFIIFLPFLFSSCNEKKTQEVITKEISYNVDGTNMKGFLVYPKNLEDTKEAQNEKRPGILVVHEWWGHNDYVRERARMLAELGYVAFALDMYGDGKTADHPKEAQSFAGSVFQNMSLAQKKFQAALDLLKAQENVDASKIAVVGYCFGGSIAINMGKIGMDLRGVVSFHGGLKVPAKVDEERVTAKFLILNGADDPMISKEDKENLKKELEDIQVDIEIVDYPNAKHAFTNPSATEKGEKFGLPLAYNKEADVASWNKMKDFLKGLFIKQ